MSSEQTILDGMVPDSLKVRSSSILLDELEVRADIGFHDFEVGEPQRLLVTVEIWVADLSGPVLDDPGETLDYDYLRSEVKALAAARRYNLQESLAHAIYERFAQIKGVTALRVATAKPDVYPDTRRVGVEIASFQRAGAPTEADLARVEQNPLRGL
jgi:dihydroneopterin aldolase